MGRRLASLLNNAIDSAAGDDSRGDVVSRVARAAGISSGTLSQILRADINCPPMRRISGFARSLNVTVAQMERAMNQDGCNAEEMSAVAQGVNVPELLFDVKDKENQILELQKQNDELSELNLSLSKNAPSESKLSEKEAQEMKSRMVLIGNRGQG